MKIIPVIFCALLFSCGTKDISYNYPDNPDYARKSRAGTAFSKGDLAIYGGKKKEEKSSTNSIATTEVNSKSALAQSALWQSSVEVISALFPVAILNTESGIITTEWYQDSASSNERIKINALIKGTAAKKENIHLTIFRQKKSAQKNSTSSWQNFSREDSDSGTLSTKLLQDKILAKAQQK